MKGCGEENQTKSHEKVAWEVTKLLDFAWDNG